MFSENKNIEKKTSSISFNSSILLGDKLKNLNCFHTHLIPENR